MTDPSENLGEFVSQFVARTPSLSARLVRSEAIFTKGTHEAHLNEFVRTLDEPARATLASMLQSERISAFHDALAIPQEALDLGGFSLHRHGWPVAAEPHNLPLFQEWIGLLYNETEPSPV